MGILDRDGPCKIVRGKIVDSQQDSMTVQSLNIWQKTLDVTRSALASGALQSIPTHYEWVEQGGVKFLVRVVDNIRRKVEAKKAETQKDPNFNPFLPYEAELFVSDLAPNHVCILNKFNVVEHHLLIITRHFESQETMLTLQDFQALAQVMLEIDGLAFYNGGRLAGASQPHKHLQVVPLPFVPELRLPIEPIIQAALPKTGPGRVPELPFEHGVIALGIAGQDAETAGEIYFDRYQQLLKFVEFSAADSLQPLPASGSYNLLATRDWMFLVPRLLESSDRIGVNSLGFAGALLVKDELQLEKLKGIGPMNFLRRVAKPLDSKSPF
jgi:sulfate adenylyltransferase (ADP) / ATP adenylyltransferase